MKRILSFVFVIMVVFVLVNTNASGSEPVKSLFEKAVTKYYKATVNKDWDKVVTYFFPSKIIALGGMENAKIALANEMDSYTFTKWETGNFQIYHDHDDIYLGVASLTSEAYKTNQLNGKTYHIKLETGILGHTDNKGKIWHFMGVSPAERNFMGTFAPEIFQALDIPEQKLYVEENGKWEPFNTP